MKNKNIRNHDDWQTPPSLYDKLDAEFHFDFDPCPLKPTFDGLAVPWGKSNFVNPPYSRLLKEAFIRKAVAESRLGKLCVMLLPVSTSTVIFHEVIKPNANEIRFLRGRVAFKGVNSFGIWVEHIKPMHDSMLVVFRPRPMMTEMNS